MIRRFFTAVSLIAAGAASLAPVRAEQACADPQGALGVSRIVEIDAKTGPLYGAFTKYEKEDRFLGPKEVVLTFDDGPMPKYTKPILDALDKFCTKATFFYVGQMAQAYPDMVKEVMGRGHTVGTHTWSHPLNLRSLSLERATDQIERGFAAVALAAGQPIAPFFRFPGLSDSGPLLAHLQERNIAAFTVDVVSNDSYIGSPSRLAARTIDQVERQNGGIVLFHDIKASTAHALPTILTELKKRGYKIVHMRAKSVFEPLPALTAELEAKSAASEAKKAGGKKGETIVVDKPKLLPFFAAIQATTLEAASEPAVTELVPAARERVHAGGTHATANTPVVSPEETVGEVTQPATRATQAKRHARKRHKPDHDPLSLTNAVGGRY
ncbi:MAG: polysaccharide deacetylase family protein [Hyphomicrobium sp.]